MTRPWIEEEITEQPRVLSRVLERSAGELAAAIPQHGGRALHLVGCGDMFFAAEAVAWLARTRWSAPVHAWRSMDFRWASTNLTENDVVLCASVSGRTPRTIEAALAARRSGARVIGLTDNEESPLAAAVEALVLLGTSPQQALGGGRYPGYHHQIAQTKTFSATLLAELAAAMHMSGRDQSELETIPAIVATELDRIATCVRTYAAKWFESREQIAVLGSGPHLPIARYGAAKFLEYAIASHAQCIEEFNHLEAFLADERTLILLLATDSSSRQRGAELVGAWKELGARTIVVGGWTGDPQPPVDRITLPEAPLAESIFLETTALQWLAYLGATSIGRDPNAWLGGVRTDLVSRLSAITVRGSTILGGDGTRER